MIKRILLMMTAFTFAGVSMSQASIWVADPVHTNVGFRVRHLMISNVSGNFPKFEAKVDYDASDIIRSKVQVTVEVGSISTGNEKRDADLRSARYFDVAKYPTMAFVSKRITKTSSGIDIVGDLTLHGITKEITLAVVGPTPPIKTPMDTRMGASATAKIDRRDFGLMTNMPLEGGGVAVGNDVNIDVEAEFVLQQP